MNTMRTRMLVYSIIAALFMISLPINISFAETESVTAIQTETLDESQVIIMRPHKSDPTNSLVYIKDSSDSEINKILRQTPSFVTQVKTYQQIQIDKFKNSIKENFPNLSQESFDKIVANYKPDPVYMVLNENLKGVSFATTIPFALIEKGEATTTTTKIKAAPLVTLSPDTINELKNGDSWGAETVCHEIGHVIMYPTHGLLNYPYSATELIIEQVKNEGHWKGKVTTPTFAMLEGWAEFNGAYFTNGSIQNYTSNKDVLKSYDEMIRTEGITAKIMLTICEDTTINPDRQKGYEKILTTMRTHKCRTLNSFLVDYVKDYPADKETVEKIVSSETNGVVSIDYNYTFKEWLNDKTEDNKNLLTAVKPWLANTVNGIKKWFSGLFKKKDDSSTTKASNAPSVNTSSDEQKTVKSIDTTKLIYVVNASNEELSALQKKQKALYEEYKKAVTNDSGDQDKLLKEISEINEAIKIKIAK